MQTKYKVGNSFKSGKINHIYTFIRYNFNLYKKSEHKLEKLRTGNQKRKRGSQWNQKINLGQVHKTVEFLSRLSRMQARGQITDIRNGRWHIVRSSVHIKWRRKEYCENVFIHKFDHPDEMNQFLEKHKLTKFTESE